MTYLPKSNSILQYHLGLEKDHMVYEAEVIGLMVAAKLLLSEQTPTPNKYFCQEPSSNQIQ
jgi:hypothetical protein